MARRRAAVPAPSRRNGNFAQWRATRLWHRSPVARRIRGTRAAEHLERCRPPQRKTPTTSGQTDRRHRSGARRPRRIGYVFPAEIGPKNELLGTTPTLTGRRLPVRSVYSQIAEFLVAASAGSPRVRFSPITRNAPLLTHRDIATQAGDFFTTPRFRPPIRVVFVQAPARLLRRALREGQVGRLSRQKACRTQRPGCAAAIVAGRYGNRMPRVRRPTRFVPLRGICLPNSSHCQLHIPRVPSVACY